MPADDGHKSKLSLHSSGNDKSFEKIHIFIKKIKNLVKMNSKFFYGQIKN